MKSVCILLVAISLGCAGGNYKTIGMVTNSVDTSMKVYSDLVKLDKVPMDIRVKIEKSYLVYQKAMAVVESAYDSYNAQIAKGLTPSDQPLKLALVEVKDCASSLVDLVNQIRK